ncbi:hypothetical protein P9112_005599 [Eukaryota sp. TZLM1-RC]
MFLHSVSIRGFKSLEKVVLGPFHHHTNCICGPNGSGKSNILDAICFALSEQHHNLRVPNLSELFTRRTANGANCAEVTLHFRNQDVQNNPYPEKEYNLNVKMFQDKPSRLYKLNGRGLSPAELKKFLLTNDLDLTSSLMVVRQSAVTALCTSKPEVLAGFISTASGASQFEIARREAESELEKARDAHKMVEKNISELKRSISAFEDSRNLVLKKQSLSDEFQNQEKKLLKLERFEDQKKLQSLKDELHTLLQKRNDLNTLLERNRSKSKEITSLIEQSRAKVNSMDQRSTKLESLIKEKDHELTMAEKKKQLLLHHQQQNIEDTKSSEHYRNQLKLKESHLRQDITSLQQKIQANEEVLKNISTSNDINNVVDQELQGLLERKHELDEDLSNGNLEVEEYSASLARQTYLKEQLDKLDGEGLIRQSISELESTIATLTQNKVDLEDNLKNLSTFKSIASLNTRYKTVGTIIENIDFGKWSTAVYALIEPFLNVFLSFSVDESAQMMKELSQKFGTVRIWSLDKLSFDNRGKTFPTDYSVTDPATLIKANDSVFVPAIKRLISNTVFVEDERHTERLTNLGYRVITINGIVHSKSSVSFTKKQTRQNSYVTHYLAQSQQKQEYHRCAAQLDNVRFQLSAIKNQSTIKANELRSHEELRLEYETLQSYSLEGLQQLQSKVTTLKAEQTQINQQIGLLKKSQNNCQDNVIQQLTDSVLNDQKLLEKLHKDLHKTQMSLDEASESTEPEDLSEQIDGLTHFIDENKPILDAFNVEQNDCKTQMSNILHELNGLKETDSSLTSLLYNDSLSLEDCENRVTQLESTIKQLHENNNELSMTEHEVEATLENKSTIQNRISSLKAEIEVLSSSVDSRSITLTNVEKTEREKQLNSFNEQLNSLDIAVSKLKDGIEKYREKIADANRSVIDAVDSFMAKIIGKLIPNKAIRVHYTDPLYLTDVEIQVSSGDYSDWEGLTSLSGGQRTLISTAFLLSLARTSKKSLYLLDEIDGALDETNQVLLGQLLKQIIDCSQIISVSHNSMFQQFFSKQFVAKMTEQNGTVIDSVRGN